VLGWTRLGWARFGVRALRIAEVKVAEGPAWGEAAVLLSAGGGESAVLAERFGRYTATREGKGADCVPSPNFSLPRTKRSSALP